MHLGEHYKILTETDNWNVTNSKENNLHLKTYDS